jgi:hypothetical protein
VKLPLVLLGLAVCTPVIAQEQPRKKPRAAAKQQAHTKATPEQVRKFKQLEEKEKQKK